MKIKIKDISWGINRITGAKQEQEVENIEFEAIIGKTVEIGPLKKVFSIKEINDNYIVVILNKNGAIVEIEKGNSYTYRPRSFDGGHYYIIEVE